MWGFLENMRMNNKYILWYDVTHSKRLIFMLVSVYSLTTSYRSQNIFMILCEEHIRANCIFDNKFGYHYYNIIYELFSIYLVILHNIYKLLLLLIIMCVRIFFHAQPLRVLTSWFRKFTSPPAASSTETTSWLPPSAAFIRAVLPY